MNRSGGLPVVAFLSLSFLVAARVEDDPLHVRIEKEIESAHVGPTAPPADDASFLRRITLDLTGTIPSAADVRTFLDDRSPDKRVKAIDRLLASPGYVRHMATADFISLMSDNSPAALRRLQ